MAQTLAKILQKSLANTKRPDSYDAFVKGLERSSDRTPILPQVRESPENLGRAAEIGPVPSKPR